MPHKQSSPAVEVAPANETFILSVQRNSVATSYLWDWELSSKSGSWSLRIILNGGRFAQVVVPNALLDATDLRVMIDPVPVSHSTLKIPLVAVLIC